MAGTNQSDLDAKYGAFRIVRGAQVLKVGDMNELEATQIAGEIKGASVEHQDPVTHEWREW